MIPRPTRLERLATAYAVAWREERTARRQSARWWANAQNLDVLKQQVGFTCDALLAEARKRGKGK